MSTKAKWQISHPFERFGKFGNFDPTYANTIEEANRHADEMASEIATAFYKRERSEVVIEFLDLPDAPGDSEVEWFRQLFNDSGAAIGCNGRMPWGMLVNRIRATVQIDGLAQE